MNTKLRTLCASVFSFLIMCFQQFVASMPRIGPSPVPSIVTCLGRLPGLYSEKFFMIKVKRRLLNVLLSHFLCHKEDHIKDDI